MAVFYREYFEKMKDYFHPNIVTFTDHYTDDKGVVELPAFHGCGLKNRNSTKKLKDYRNGNQCQNRIWYLPYDKILDPG